MFHRRIRDSPNLFPNIADLAAAAVGQGSQNSLEYASYEQGDDNNDCRTDLVVGHVTRLMNVIHSFYCPVKARQGLMQASGMCRFPGLNALLRWTISDCSTASKRDNANRNTGKPIQVDTVDSDPGSTLCVCRQSKSAKSPDAHADRAMTQVKTAGRDVSIQHRRLGLLEAQRFYVEQCCREASRDARKQFRTEAKTIYMIREQWL